MDDSRLLQHKLPYPLFCPWLCTNVKSKFVSWFRVIATIAPFGTAYCDGFPAGSVVKNPPANAGDTGDVVSGSRRFPGEGNGYPLLYFCLGNPMEREAWWLQSTWSQKGRHDLATKIATGKLS